MKAKLLKKVIACVLVISTLLAVSIVPAFANELRDTVEYDTVIDGITIHTVEKDGIKTVTYTENDATFTFVFNGDSIQLTKDDEVVFLTSASVKCENELKPRAAYSTGTVKNSCDGYRYSVTTCVQHANGVFKIPSSSEKRVSNVLIGSSQMTPINNFVLEVNKINNYYNTACGLIGVTYVLLVVAAVASGGTVAVALAALGFDMTALASLTGMINAEQNADFYFLQIH